MKHDSSTRIVRIPSFPRWLASPGMEVDKIAQFYEDPVKKAYDTFSHAKAFHLRSLSIEPGLTWQARRWMRFMARLGVGLLRETHARLAAKPRDSTSSDPPERKSA